MSQSRNIPLSRIAFVPEEDVIIAALFPVNRTQDVAALIDRPARSVDKRAALLGVSKCPVYLATKGCRRNGHEAGSIATRFKPGQVPANKGLRRPGWAPGRMAQTQFKKGQVGNKFVPIGSERTNVDGYLDRKIAATGKTNLDWKAVHVLLWIQHHGAVPEGHAVVFRDRNKKNICIENLELLSRAELMQRNTIHRYPPELRQVIRLSGKLKRTIKAKK